MPTHEPNDWTPFVPALSEEQMRELERRADEDDAFPDDVIPWEEVQAMTRARLHPPPGSGEILAKVNLKPHSENAMETDSEKVFSQRHNTSAVLLAINTLKHELTQIPAGYHVELEFLIQKYCHPPTVNDSFTYWGMIETLLAQASTTITPGFVKLKRELREDMGSVRGRLRYDQAGFASLIGTTQPMISLFENKNRGPSESELLEFTLSICLKTHLGVGVLKSKPDEPK